VGKQEHNTPKDQPVQGARGPGSDIPAASGPPATDVTGHAPAPLNAAPSVPLGQSQSDDAASTPAPNTKAPKKPRLVVIDRVIHGGYEYVIRAPKTPPGVCPPCMIAIPSKRRPKSDAASKQRQTKPTIIVVPRARERHRSGKRIRTTRDGTDDGPPSPPPESAAARGYLDMIAYLIARQIAEEAKPCK